jgi:peroxiredoxin
MRPSSCVLFAVLLMLQLPAWSAVQVNAPAPDFTLPDSRGAEHALSDYRGKVVVLEWTNHDCPFVRKHYGSDNMQSLQRTFTGRDVVWLSVISSAPGKQGHVSPEQADQLTASRNAAPTAVLLDSSGEVGRSYGAKTTPHMYIIDPQGTLVYMGGIDSIRSANPADIPKATPYVALSLNEVLAGQPVSNPVTRPYGCTVKY